MLSLSFWSYDILNVFQGSQSSGKNSFVFKDNFVLDPFRIFPSRGTLNTIHGCNIRLDDFNLQDLVSGSEEEEGYVVYYSYQYKLLYDVPVRYTKYIIINILSLWQSVVKVPGMIQSRKVVKYT